MSNKLKNLKSRENENRNKINELNNDLKEMSILQDEYHTLSLNLKNQIDHVYLCWTGKEAMKYIAASNNDLVQNKQRFDFVIDEQKQKIKEEQEKLEQDYDQIKKEISIISRNKDEVKEVKDENKCTGN